jgi:hypothetical protein
MPQIYQYCRNKNKIMSIKATELRVGNKIIANGLHEGKIMTVEQIGAKGMLRDDYRIIIFEEHRVGEFLRDCKGVELCEEILLKCGFEKQENNWWKLCICNGWTYLYWERLAGLELSVNKHSVMQPHIKYLYQLQNLYFALTGEELQINL